MRLPHGFLKLPNQLLRLPHIFAGVPHGLQIYEAASCIFWGCLMDLCVCLVNLWGLLMYLRGCLIVLLGWSASWLLRLPCRFARLPHSFSEAASCIFWGCLMDLCVVDLWGLLMYLRDCLVVLWGCLVVLWGCLVVLWGCLIVLWGCLVVFEAASYTSLFC